MFTFKFEYEITHRLKLKKNMHFCVYKDCVNIKYINIIILHYHSFYLHSKYIDD